MIRHFINALGFLTRLGPARVLTDEDISRSTAYMPLVGLVLGAVIALPFGLGLFRSAPWVQAWLMVGLSVFLTRGLHFDGVADVSDAITTHGDPERFWQVIKDSRSGAFGVIGLVLALGGQVILFHALATANMFPAIAWAFVLGRTACVGFAYTVHHLTRPGLGRLSINGSTLPVTALSALGTLALGILVAGPLKAIAAMAICAALLYRLHSLAERADGVNGDFLGCSIVLGEISAGLGCALFLC